MKHAVEALGVPHTEVELIIVNGDRFDLHIAVPRMPFTDIAEPEERGSPGRTRDDRAARAVQLERGGRLNARLDSRALWRVVKLGAEQRALLKRAADRWPLSARGSLRVRKVARTIADLEQSPAVTTAHVAEALQLRPAANRLDKPAFLDLAPLSERRAFLLERG